MEWRGCLYIMNNIQQAIADYNARAPHPFHPRAVLFDMDGVLYDSMPHHAIAWQKSMAQFGITMTPHDAYATEGARGFDTVREMVKRQKGIDISEERAKEIYGVKSSIFHNMPEAPIFDGVKALMQKIVDSGLSVNVVTGSAQKPLIARLNDDFGQWLAPNHITTAYDVTHGKPDPDPYLTGLRKAGDLMPWQGIVVENAPLGVRSGVAAKIFTVAINSGPLPDTALANEGCNLLYQRLSDFLNDWDILMAAVRG
jgi:beta-phosphoglucomutase